MKIGQPKLPERTSQTGGLFVTHANLQISSLIWTGDYYLKSGIPIWNLDLMTSRRTNLFYLPKYFRKNEVRNYCFALSFDL
jgi:hypothetical protein